MKKRNLFLLIIILSLFLFSSSGLSQTRTPWEMHNGLEVTSSNPRGLIQFANGCRPAPRHGAICEYDVATVPSEEDTGWGSAPNPDIIDFHIPSRVCYAPITCRHYGDFTYFQTFVNIPSNVVMNQFTISFSGMDDGSRITIFNSDYPNGLVITGSYVYLGGSGTSNLVSYVKSGEINRVVITQVDDCCSQNNLRVARVNLNGQVIETNDPPVAEDDKEQHLNNFDISSLIKT